MGEREREERDTLEDFYNTDEHVEEVQHGQMKSGRKKEKRTVLMRRIVWSENTGQTRLMISEHKHEQTTGHASHRGQMSSTLHSGPRLPGM